MPLSVGPSTVGGPVYFTHGPFTGKTVRTSAAELQKADAGRKYVNIIGVVISWKYRHGGRYARRDKRPLDPPPVVQVRFFEVHNAGTSQQRETEIMAYE